MKAAYACFATLIALTQTLCAAESARLERAVHDAAQAARRAKIQSVLVLVREDARSTKSVDTEQTMGVLRKQLMQMLDRESDVNGKVDKEVSDQATKTRARRSLQPSEAEEILKDTDTDAVLTADFREYRGQFSVRITLVDARKTHLNVTVNLESRPQAESVKPDGDKDKKDKAKSKTGVVDGNDGESGPPPEAKGATGYVVRRKEQSGIARTRGGPGSIGVPARGFGEKADGKGISKGEREDGDNKKDNSKDSQEDGETGDGEGKSDNAARRGPVPNSRMAKDVVRFATSQIGKQVGNGQCWTLAAEALKAAGAEPPKGYTYGDEIAVKDIQPGDILQFTTARFDEPGYWAVLGTPDHTAVVYSLGDRTFILHQNFSGKKYVQTFDLDFDNLTSGRVQAYRPRPARPFAAN